VDGELQRVASVLTAGAYVPMLDHFIPPDISYATYRYYVERRRELLAAAPGQRRLASA
jgi:hypothetical protein